MKYFLFLLFLSFISPAYSQQDKIAPSLRLTNTSITEAEQRKFDFFLYEGARETMLNNVDNAIANYAQCYAIDKNSPVVLYELAKLMNTNVADNISFMKTAVSLAPSNVFYLTYLANLYFKVGQNAEGISTYIKIHQLQPEDDDFTYLLARTSGYLGELKTSLQYFDLLEKRLGVSYAISAGRIEVFEKAGKIKEGEREYKRLIEFFPRNTEYLTMLGQYYMSHRLFSKATDIFLPLTKQPETAGESFLSLALLHLTEGDSASALNYFVMGLSDPILNGERKMSYIKLLKLKESYIIYLLGNRTVEFLNYIIKSNPKEVESLLYLGFYFEADMKDSSVSSNYFHLATITDPDNFEAWKYLLSNYGFNSRFKDILTEGKTALLYFPEDPSLLYYYGVACSVEGNDSLAILSFERAINSLKSQQSDNKTLFVGVYSSLGDCYYRTNNVQKCFRAYEEVLLLNPNSVVVLNNYAYYLSEKGLDLAKAETMSAKVIQLEPGNATYLDTYAWVLFKLKRYTEAKFIMERAIDNGGDSSEVILEHYGDILFVNGSSTEALKYWKLANVKGNTSPILLMKIDKGVYLEQ